jgi:hypothetical protein
MLLALAHLSGLHLPSELCLFSNAEHGVFLHFNWMRMDESLTGVYPAGQSWHFPSGLTTYHDGHAGS